MKALIVVCTTAICAVTAGSAWYLNHKEEQRVIAAAQEQFVNELQRMTCKDYKMDALKIAVGGKGLFTAEQLKPLLEECEVALGADF